MRASFIIFYCFVISFCHSQSSTTSFSVSSDSSTSTYANSSPSSSPYSSSTQSTVLPGSASSTDSFNSSTFDSSNVDNTEKLVTYTTGQKTIFICVCGGTFVLLIALAILSGLSDTIARSKQKTKRTHA